MKKLLVAAVALAGVCAYAQNSDIKAPAAPNTDIVAKSEANLPQLFMQYDSQILDKAAALAAQTKSVEKTVYKTVAKIDLKSLSNKYLLTDKTFNTAKGAPVYVSLTQAYNVSANKYNDFYFTFKSGKETHFANAWAVANVPVVKDGHKDIMFEGGKYTAKFNIHNVSPMSNELVVENAGNVVFKTSMQELADSMRKTAASAQLSKEYGVFFVNKVMQDANKNLKQTDEKLFIFFSKDANKSTVLPYNSIYGHGWVSFPEFEPNYSFSIANGSLLIAIH